jgi:hypothetical protein
MSPFHPPQPQRAGTRLSPIFVLEDTRRPRNLLHAPITCTELTLQIPSRLGWNGCAKRCNCGAVILSTGAAGGVLRAFAAETCWCVERKTEGGPTALGGSETSTF